MAIKNKYNTITSTGNKYDVLSDSQPNPFSLIPPKPFQPLIGPTVPTPITSSDNTPMGIAVNTVKGLPQAVVDIAKKAYGAVETIAPGLKATRESVQQGSPEPYKKFWSDQENKIRNPLVMGPDGKPKLNTEVVSNLSDLVLGFTMPGGGEKKVVNKVLTGAEEKAPVVESKLLTPETPTQPSLFEKKPSITPLEMAQQEADKIPNSVFPGAESFANEPLEKVITDSLPKTGKPVPFWDYLSTPHYVLEKMGLGQQAKDLATASRNYFLELPKNMAKIGDWAKSVPAESNPRIFDFLDGQPIDLNPQEAKVAGEIKTWLSQWADRLGMKPDERITNYITHIFPAGKGGEFPDEIAKLIRNKLPGSVYDPFMLERQGAEGFVKDTWAALDAYVKRATRKVNMDPALAGIKEASSQLSAKEQDYLQSYIEGVNFRPTKLDNAIDDGIKAVVGYRLGVRPTKQMTELSRRVVSRAKLGLSFTSAFKNLTQGVNNFAELGTKYTMKGYTDLLKKGTKELNDVGVLSQGFVEDRLSSSVKKFWEKADRVTFWNFEATEAINRGAAYYGAKAKALAMGKTEAEAIQYGIDISAKTQFLFGSIDTPVALRSDLVKTLGQFQTFSLKQAEFLARKVKQKEYASLARYVGASAVVFGGIGSAFGMSFWDLIPGFRFGVPPSLDLPVRAYKNITGAKNDYGQTPTGAARLRDMGNALLTDVVPGGTQINRSLGGLSAVAAGKSTTAAGNWQYKVAQTPANYVRAGLFGKSNLSEAKAYYDKKGSSKTTSTHNKYNTI